MLAVLPEPMEGKEPSCDGRGVYTHTNCPFSEKRTAKYKPTLGKFDLKKLENYKTSGFVFGMIAWAQSMCLRYVYTTS